MEDKYILKIIGLVLGGLCALAVVTVAAMIITFNLCDRKVALAISAGVCVSAVFVLGISAVILERRYAIAAVITNEIEAVKKEQERIEAVKKEQEQKPGIHIEIKGDGAVAIDHSKATMNKSVTDPRSDGGLGEMLAQLQKQFEDVQKSSVSDKEKEMAATAHDNLKKAVESKNESIFNLTAEGLKGAAQAVAGAFPAIFEVLQKIKELVFK